jgi:hypothetical protein
VDEDEPLIGGDLRKAITLLQSAARLFGMTTITGKAGPSFNFSSPYSMPLFVDQRSSSAE